MLFHVANYEYEFHHRCPQPERIEKDGERDGRKQESSDPEPRDAFVTRRVAVQGD